MEEKKDQVENGINLLDYLIVILSRKKFILLGTFGLALIVGIIVYIMPNKYKGEVRFMPPQQSSAGSLVAGALSSQLGGLSSLTQGILGVKSPGYTYVGYLTSRTVLDRIIDRFDLMKRYDTNWFFPFKREEARKKIVEDIMTAATDDNSGIVTVGVLEKDPKLAADMANAFLEEMMKLCDQMSAAEAAPRKLFYETRLKEARENLAKAEDAMRAFQEKTGVLQVDDQAKAVIESIALAKAQIVGKEVEIKVMKTYSTPQNPDLQKAQESLKGLKMEVAKLEANTGAGPDPLMPTGRMASVGVEYYRKLRDVKFNEALNDILVKLYESAKIDEAREAPNVQVIDKAVVADKKTSPKRILIIIVTAFMGFFFFVFLSFFLEWWSRMSVEPDNRTKIEDLKRYSRVGRGKK